MSVETADKIVSEERGASFRQSPRRNALFWRNGKNFEGLSVSVYVPFRGGYGWSCRDEKLDWSCQMNLILMFSLAATLKSGNFPSKSRGEKSINMSKHADQFNSRRRTAPINEVFWGVMVAILVSTVRMIFLLAWTGPKNEGVFWTDEGDNQCPKISDISIVCWFRSLFM